MIPIGFPPYRGKIGSNVVFCMRGLMSVVALIL